MVTHTRMLLVLATLLGSSCSTELTDGGPWVPWQQVASPLQPEVDLTTYDGDVRSDRLRLVTFNVEYGADIDALIAALTEQPELAAADLLLLQEIESYPDEGRSRTAKLADALAMNYVYAPARTEGSNGTHGLAVLSRFPLSDVQVMQLPQADFHIRKRQRIAVAATVHAGDRELRIVNVHLDVRLNITDRIAQFHPITTSVPLQVMIAGDLNTNPYLWLGSIPVLPEQATTNSDQATMFDDYMRAYEFDTPTADSGPTQDAVIKQLRLDSVYTRELATGALGIVTGLKLSDHSPIWLDVDW